MFHHKSFLANQIVCMLDTLHKPAYNIYIDMSDFAEVDRDVTLNEVSMMLAHRDVARHRLYTNSKDGMVALTFDGTPASSRFAAVARLKHDTSTDATKLNLAYTTGGDIFYRSYDVSSDGMCLHRRGYYEVDEEFEYDWSKLQSYVVNQDGVSNVIYLDEAFWVEWRRVMYGT